MNSNRRENGSVIVTVVVIGLVLLTLGFALYRMVETTIIQKGSRLAKERTAILRDSIRIISNGFCDTHPFKGVGGVDLSYNPATSNGDFISLNRIAIGTSVIANTESTDLINGVIVTDMKFKQKKKFPGGTRLVELEITGKTNDKALFGGLSNFYLSQNLEISLSGSTISNCLDRNVYFETAIAERNAITYENVGCDAVTDAPAPPAYAPAANRQGIWENSTSIYRKVPQDFKTPITAVWPPIPAPIWNYAILAEFNCSPANNSHMCASNCKDIGGSAVPTGSPLTTAEGVIPGGYYIDDCAPVTGGHPQTLPVTPVIPLDSWKAPPPSPASSHWANGCTTDPADPNCGCPGVTGKHACFCTNFSMMNGLPEQLVRVVNVDQPQFNPMCANGGTVTTPTDDWNNFHKGRTAAAPAVDYRTSGVTVANPPLLKAAEKRCWVRIVDLPQPDGATTATSPPSPDNGDNVFFVAPGTDLNIGCRLTNPPPTSLPDLRSNMQPWQLMGCLQGYQGAAGTSGGDHDVGVKQYPDAALIPTSTQCSTSDHLQPHIGGIWSMSKVSLTAFCGRIVNE